MVGSYLIVCTLILREVGSPIKRERKSRLDRSLSELEGCVLGLVWAKGPCTPYTVRKVFQASPSAFWSGSAGAIYPLFKRLERHGFIRSEKQTRGRKQQRKHYTLTMMGKNALRVWLKPASDWIFAVPPDPLRTRMDFLEALPPTARRRFLATARTKIRSQMKIVEKDCVQKLGQQYPYLVASGALKTTRARLEWLDEAIAQLESEA